MFRRQKRESTSGRGGAESSSYFRSKTPVRPGAASWKRFLLRWMVISAILFSLALSTAYSIEDYVLSDPHFVFPLHFQGLEVSGLRYLSSDAVTQAFQEDLGGSIAGIPLEERRYQLSGIPWVEQVTILRIWPNRLWVHVEERRPIAFVRAAGGKARGLETPQLLDRNGVFLDIPEGAQFSLPVISGISGEMPPPARRRRVALFEKLMQEMDSTDPPYSSRLSEIDVTDPRNARVITVHNGDVVDLQMGETEFRHRYELFLRYIEDWRREFGPVRSVDLRFEGHVAFE